MMFYLYGILIGVRIGISKMYAIVGQKPHE